MNSSDPVVVRLLAALPRICEWIDSTIAGARPAAIRIADLGFKRLRPHLPSTVLERSRVVRVPKVPVPPLAAMGLVELAELERLDLAGITLKDMIFVDDSQISESLCFHELVHVMQWDRLGAERFLIAYGLGVAHHGYRESPLEQAAYSLQSDFDRRALSGIVADLVNERTDAVWAAVAALVGKGFPWSL